MGKTRYIETTNPEDLDELFSFLCREVIDTPKDEAKRIILGFNGPDKMVANRKPKAEDIIALCQKKGLGFEFKLKVIYEDHVVRPAEQKEEIVDPNEDVKVSEVHKMMADQKKDIKLSDDAPIPAAPPADIPDFE